MHILDVFKKCSVLGFPIDIQQLLMSYGYSIYTYEELRQENELLYTMCIAFSNDAFREGNSHIVAYNEKMPSSRVRFSLAHELGHHILNHKGSTRRNEIEANYFASHLLAPRVIIYYSKCKSPADIRRTFHLSAHSADIVWEDYLRWYRCFCRKGKQLTAVEYELYQHFYARNSLYN